jgi:hypothetical protein
MGREDRAVKIRANSHGRTFIVVATAILTLLAVSGCSIALSNRVTADEVVGEWITIDEPEGSDALDSSLTLRSDGVAIGRKLPPQALDYSSSVGTVSFVGSWKIARGSHPLDFAHVVLDGSATVDGRTEARSFELRIDGGPPRLLSVWLDKADFSRKLTFARTAPD